MPSNRCHKLMLLVDKDMVMVNKCSNLLMDKTIRVSTLSAALNINSKCTLSTNSLDFIMIKANLTNNMILEVYQISNLITTIISKEVILRMRKNFCIKTKISPSTGQTKTAWASLEKFTESSQLNFCSQPFSASSPTPITMLSIS